MPQSSAHPTASYTPGSGQRSIGVAVIGAGERGIYYVGSRMAELARETGFRIVAVHDRLPERAQMAARHLNAIYASQGLGPLARPAVSLAEAVSDPQVDLVIVTTHTNAHLEPVRVAAAGKRIYLDKPISVSLADARGIVAIEALCVGIHMSWWPAIGTLAIAQLQGVWVYLLIHLIGLCVFGALMALPERRAYKKHRDLVHEAIDRSELNRFEVIGKIEGDPSLSCIATRLKKDAVSA